MTATPEDSVAGKGTPTGPSEAPSGPPSSGPRGEKAKRGAPRPALRDFLYRLVAYVKARKLYPPGHDRLAKQMESWLEAAETVFASQKEVSFFVQPKAIFVSGEEFGPDDRILSEFAPEFVKRLVRYVTVEEGVTAAELEALAEPLLLEPEALQEAGGARALISERGVSHVLVIEFSYDMGRYLTSDEDVEVVRTLARYELGVMPEQYVLHRLGELELSPQEKDLMGKLLLDPEVGRKLASLAQVLGQFSAGTETEVHTSDLVVYVVRSLVETGQELGEVVQENAVQLLSHMLGQVNERLLVTLADTDVLRRREVLSRVAKQMMASPDALLRWVAPDADQMSVTLSPDLAELLKAIFSRAQSGPRRVRFGETVLKTLEAPTEAPTEPSARTARADEHAVDLAALGQRFTALREELGQRRLTMGPVAVTPAHVDILLQLLRGEDQPAARERVLRELGTFLGRQLSGDGDQRDLHLADRVIGGEAQLSDEDLQSLLLAPEVCQQALREFLRGEERWRGALERLADRHQASFAGILGTLVLWGGPAAATKQLDGLIRGCQDELVDWLQRQLDTSEDPPPLDRVVSLTLACRTIRVVPLVERLLGQVAPEARRALLRTLVFLDDARAISVLNDLLFTGDRPTRGVILYLLGESGHPLAEEALLDVAARRHWLGGDLEERLVALSSLARCGTARSRALLERLAESWLLGLTAGGRQVRERARQALAAVQARLAAPGPEIEEEGTPAPSADASEGVAEDSDT